MNGKNRVPTAAAAAAVTVAAVASPSKKTKHEHNDDDRFSTLFFLSLIAFFISLYRSHFDSRSLLSSS